MADLRQTPASAAVDGVSAVVCCHNSAARLPETLARLAAQKTSAPWEVVLVDNGSTDGTADAARRVWRSHGEPCELRVVAEPEPGLSRARQRGVAEARHTVIVFVDDDNWLDADYLELAHEIMARHPRIGALGGEIRAIFETPPPSWFPSAQSYFAVGPQAAADGDITAHKLHVAGAGMVLRKSAFDELQRLGFTSLLSDRTRSDLSSGGDTELCLALALLGYRIWYDSRLQLTHFITTSRLSRRYLFRLAKGIDASSPVLACYEDVIRGVDRSAIRVYAASVFRRLAWALRAMARMVLGRTSPTFCQLEWLSLWHHLTAFRDLIEAFEQRARLARLSIARRWQETAAEPHMGAEAC